MEPMTVVFSCDSATADNSDHFVSPGFTKHVAANLQVQAFAAADTLYQPFIAKSSNR